MHIFSMLIASVQSFKLIAWRPWEELITQTCYPILKANLKAIKVENTVILLKIIFSPAKYSMHISNMFTTSILSFKLIAWTLWEKLITHTCYPILKPYLKIVKNAVILSKVIFSSETFTCTFSICFNICAKFQNDCLKILEGVDNTNLLPHIETLPQNCLSQKWSNFVKNYFFVFAEMYMHIFYMFYHVWKV